MPDNPNPQGDPNPGDPSTAPGNPPQGDPANPPADLGEAGKAALTAERAARKEAEKATKAATDRAAELEAEVKRLQRANAAVKGTDLEAIKADISAEFASKMLATEIKAEAKGKLRDAADVARYPEYFKDLTAGDDAAISAAVTKLLTDKPYLAGEPAEQWGDVGGGKGGAKPEPTSPQERMARAYGSK